MKKSNLALSSLLWGRALSVGLIATQAFVQVQAQPVAFSLGEAQVSNGSFNYTIDIKTPKGIAGLKPALAIGYSSNNTNNGMLGVGFSLSGLSAITKCNENTFAEYSDGARNYNYCLDGQKLLLVNPAQTYGANGTVYRTEMNNQSKITKTSWGWQVHSKDGLIHDYGLNADATRGDLSYSISQIRDRFNNQINFNYGGGSDAQYISQISYAGNTIDFNYEARTDTAKHLYRGLVSIAEVRLKNIVVKAGGSEIGTTSLNYGTSSRGESMITSVQECVGVICIDPIYFDWQQPQYSSGQFDIQAPFSPASYNMSQNDYRYLSGDFNGDGRTDVAHLAFTDGLHVWLANEDGSFNIQNKFPSWSYNLNYNDYNFKVGDFNGDGKSDLVHFAYTDGVHVWLSNGDGTFNVANKFPSWSYSTSYNDYNFKVGDFNGDGKSDLIHFAYDDGVHVWTSNGDGTFNVGPKYPSWDYNTHYNDYNFQVGDFNGDGKSDLVHFAYADGVHVWTSNGDGTFNVADKFPSWNYNTSNNNYAFAVGDFNGDGLSDLVHYAYSNGLHVWHSRGDGTFDVENAFHDVSYNFSVNNFNLRIGDYDGDGASDILHIPNSSGLQVWRSNKNGQFAIEALYPNGGYNLSANSYNFMSGDFDGDGASDVMHLASNSSFHVWHTHTSNDQRVLTVHNGRGHWSTVEYGDTDDTYIYVAGSSASYPELDIKNGNTTLVKSITTPDGVGGTDITTFKYHGLKYHRERGSLGFAKIEETNSGSNTYSVTEYHQDFPYAGLVKNSKVYVAGDLVSQKDELYNHSYYYSSSGIINMQRIQSTKHEYTEGLMAKTVDVFSNFDAYGNVGQVTSSVYNASNSLVKQTVTVNTFSNTESNWLLSRLTDSQVTHIVGANQQTKRTSYSYDGTTGALLTETIEPNTSYWSNKQYLYDSFGNVTRTIEAGANVTSRTSYASYSANGKNVLTKTNPLGHVSSLTYNTNGTVATSTDINGLVTTFEYDAFGRLTKKTDPTGIETTTTRAWDSSVTNGLIKETVSVTGEQPVVIYYDLFNRQIRLEKTGFDGRIIREDTVFNARGEVISESSKYYVGDTPLWANTTYDNYGRKTQITSPAPNGATAITSISYNGLTVTTTYPGGQSKQVIKNAIGQVIEINEQGTQMRYQYSPTGSLTKTIDTNGNEIVLEYDARGNKTKSTDPNKGVWTYTYNAFGELASQKDAKGQQITYVYDQAGRKVSETSPDGTSTWVYDTKHKRKLTSHATSSITVTFGYDQYGRANSKSTTVDGKTYREVYAYNNNGRKVSENRHGGMYIQYIYNQYGYLERIQTPLGAVNNFNSENYIDDVIEALYLQSDLLEQQLETQQQANEYSRQADLLYANGLIDNKQLQSLLIAATLLQQKADKQGKLAALYGKSADGLLNQMTRYKLDLSASDYQTLATAYKFITQQQISRIKRTLGNGSSKAVSATLDTAHDNLQYSRKFNLLSLKSGLKNSAKDDITRSSSAHVFYRVTNMDAFDRVTSYETGDGMKTTNSFDDSGVLLNTKSIDISAGTTYRDLDYSYDISGNVTAKNDLQFSYNHQYSYDSLDRLTSDSLAIGGNVTNTTYQYDVLGNITYRSDIGNYSYSNAKPHQLTSAGSRTYSFDANGSMTNNNGKAISYNAYDKPISIQTKNNTVTFAYDANQNRYKKTTNDHTTYYVGNSLEAIEHNNGVDEFKHFIVVNGNTVAVHKESVDGGNTSYQTNYLFYDALGSVDSVSNYLGVTVQRMLYEAFGKVERRDRWGNLISNEEYTTRGFTGHEHIDDSDLIHMNGRVYDAAIGRFISADPFIDGVYSHYGYNRYAYVRNNPLRYTDPSGYFGLFRAIGGLFKTVAKAVSAVANVIVNNIRPIVAVAASIATGGLASAAVSGIGGAILGGAAAGFTSGAIMTGTLDGALNGALWGGVSGGIAFGIGSYAASLTQTSKFGRALIKAGLHGASRGGISAIRGNSFVSGFASGAISSASGSITSSLGDDSYALGAAVSATSGGLSSVIAGDKFENGAISGAFVYMFNDRMHRQALEKARKQAFAQTEDAWICHMVLQSCDMSGYNGYGTGYGASAGFAIFGKGQGVRCYDVCGEPGTGYSIGPFGYGGGEFSFSVSLVELSPIKQVLQAVSAKAAISGNLPAAAHLLKLSEQVPDVQLSASVAVDIARFELNGKTGTFIRVNVDTSAGLVVGPGGGGVSQTRSKQYLFFDKPVGGAR